MVCTEHDRIADGDGLAMIQRVTAREVLDSRGRPTVEVEVELTDGATSSASVPAGASTGSHEARELRDGDFQRYRGLGVLMAVRNVEEILGPAVVGRDAADQVGLDSDLIELDGTKDKSRLGANAVLGVSLAVARAASVSEGVPLWRRLADDRQPVLPLPMVNVVSGAPHGNRALDIQDFLVVPVGARSYSEALETCAVIRAVLEDALAARGLSTLKADEGGFGPDLPSTEAALDVVVDAIASAGREPGEDVAIALDVAATGLFDETSRTYGYGRGRRALSADQLIDLIDGWCGQYPIVSVEDALAEDDWEGWQRLTARLGGRLQLVGDDLFSTNVERLGRGIDSGVANAVLIKLNQVGTLTETLAAVARARDAGYACVVSARSGETEDTFLAHLAVGTGAGQIKVGSVAQSERLAKYNELLRIEETLGSDAAFAGRAALAIA
jgi:enolase